MPPQNPNPQIPLVGDPNWVVPDPVTGERTTLGELQRRQALGQGPAVPPPTPPPITPTPDNILRVDPRAAINAPIGETEPAFSGGLEELGWDALRGVGMGAAIGGGMLASPWAALPAVIGGGLIQGAADWGEKGENTMLGRAGFEGGMEAGSRFIASTLPYGIGRVASIMGNKTGVEPGTFARNWMEASNAPFGAYGPSRAIPDTIPGHEIMNQGLGYLGDLKRKLLGIPIGGESGVRVTKDIRDRQGREIGKIAEDAKAQFSPVDDAIMNSEARAKSFDKATGSIHGTEAFTNRMRSDINAAAELWAKQQPVPPYIQGDTIRTLEWQKEMKDQLMAAIKDAPLTEQLDFIADASRSSQPMGAEDFFEFATGEGRVARDLTKASKGPTVTKDVSQVKTELQAAADRNKTMMELFNKRVGPEAFEARRRYAILSDLLNDQHRTRGTFLENFGRQGVAAGAMYGVGSAGAQMGISGMAGSAGPLALAAAFATPRRLGHLAKGTEAAARMTPTGIRVARAAEMIDRYKDENYPYPTRRREPR